MPKVRSSKSIYNIYITSLVHHIEIYVWICDVKSFVQFEYVYRKGEHQYIVWRYLLILRVWNAI